MIKDTINKDWIIKTNELADQLENTSNNQLIKQFSNDQLQYLIYWNWGYSGIGYSYETVLSEEELKSRGLEYNETLADEINELCEEVYINDYSRSDY